jgi:hypothetical protein
MRALRGVTIAVDGVGQLPDQRFGLFVCQFKVHAPDMGSLVLVVTVNPTPLGGAGAPLFRPEVRDGYRRLVEQGWTDALRALHPDERIYTFWKYFRNACNV